MSKYLRIIKMDKNKHLWGAKAQNLIYNPHKNSNHDKTKIA